MKRTIGGNRLGSGNKMSVDMRTYNRSTHDLSYVWRSSMASGTLIPFMTEVALPGDTFDIDLETLIKTHPTVGPLFGSYKIQLDVFMSPIRLYQAKLHNNALNIGMKMSDIKLPQMVVGANPQKPISDNSQINSSCLLKYLNISGIGHPSAPGATEIFERLFNAIPYLTYWDIYKNYYANKQEEKGYYIHHELPQPQATITGVSIATDNTGQTYTTLTKYPTFPAWPTIQITTSTFIAEVTLSGASTLTDPRSVVLITDRGNYYLNQIFEESGISVPAQYITGTVKPQYIGINILQWAMVGDVESPAVEPRLIPFDLSNLDDMRNNILAAINNAGAFIIDGNSIEPYGTILESQGLQTAISQNQEGLAIKTYQSDLFNNWMNTEWIDGDNGVNALTSIDTSSGEFTIEQLILSRKIYDMMNRVAMSGGSYKDWIEVNYTTDFYDKCYTPMYMGGLIRELVFDEVVSNSGTPDQPLGQLAGRGVMGGKKKGGSIYIKVDEPSYIMGIISLTPRIDYSQGNKWDVNLKTMDDLHKPALDEIGFQDLITDQMAWFDTRVTNATNEVTYKSAGKQPAWINYMTNVNQTRGSFAEVDNEMFMTLNRRYEYSNAGEIGINDLTTYVDPAKFNFVFAETALDAQNFWTQIKVDIEARRVMSARMMPNL